MLTYCLNVKKTDTVNPQNCKDKKKRKSIPLSKCVARDSEESIFIKEK